MVIQHHVKGYEEFTKLAESLEGSGQTIHVFFFGGKEQQTGLSWCTYCVKGNISLTLKSINRIKNISFVL